MGQRLWTLPAWMSNPKRPSRKQTPIGKSCTETTMLQAHREEESCRFEAFGVRGAKSAQSLTTAERRRLPMVLMARSWEKLTAMGFEMPVDAPLFVNG